MDKDKISVMKKRIEEHILKLENKDFAKRPPVRVNVEKENLPSATKFIVKDGSIYVLIGPSGCGKSTILNLVANLIKPTHGKIIKPNSIGYMFQRDHLFEWRTIFKNITLGLEINGKKDLKTDINRIDDMLKKYVPNYETLARQLPNMKY